MMRRRLIEFLVLLSVAIGAGPAASAIWQWSLTPGSNATADPAINWSEGMSPSSVNDSARAMMSVVAAWRNDISAVNTTAGTSTAYTLTTSEGVTQPPTNGQMIAFVAHADNGANPKLSVDGGTSYPIWFNGSPVSAGTLIAGTPYRVAYSSTSDHWMLEAAYGNPYNVALGAFMISTAPTAPNSSFVEPAGQCISTTTYAAYWVQQGSPASGACPGGQFAIIDMRGRVPAALDTLNGSAANRLTSSSTGCGTAMTSVGSVCANGVEGRALTSAQLPANIPYNDPSHHHSITSPRTTNNGFAGSNSSIYPGQVVSGSMSLITDDAGVNITINPSGGATTPFVQPTIGVKYYLRVI